MIRSLPINAASTQRQTQTVTCRQGRHHSVHQLGTVPALWPANSWLSQNVSWGCTPDQHAVGHAIQHSLQDPLCALKLKNFGLCPCRHIMTVCSQIVASTTTPNLLPRLAESLSRNTDYKPLLEALRYAMQASYAHLQLRTALLRVNSVCAGLCLRTTNCPSIAQQCGNIAFIMLHVDS